MIILSGTTDTLTLVTTSTADTNVHVSYVSRTDAGVFAPRPQNTAITTATTTTILNAPGSATTQFAVKHISVRNKHASTSQTVTIQHAISAGTTAELKQEVLLAGEEISFTEGAGWQAFDANGNIKTIAAVTALTTKLLAADQSNSTTTLTEVAGLTVALPIGTYQYRYLVRYQAAAATTGVRFSVNFTGTQTGFAANVSWVGSINTTSSDAPSQIMVAALGGVVSAFSARTPVTTGWGTTLSVDTINADMLTVIEGFIVVTVAGNIALWHGSEVAAASTVKAGASLVLIKVG